MFTKIDKKVLIILVVALVIILLAGFAVYKYFVGAKTEAPAADNNSIQNNNSQPQVQIQAGGIQIEGDNGGGTLSVCMDKCGDGICQKTDPNCGEGDNLNCICPETLQECPQDCKN